MKTYTIQIRNVDTGETETQVIRTDKGQIRAVGEAQAKTKVKFQGALMHITVNGKKHLGSW